MNIGQGLRQVGVQAALVAALLFGIATPLAKWLLSSVNPWLLAGLLYLGSGVGLSLYRLFTKAKPCRIPLAELPWLVGAIVAGGIIAPVLLMIGLSTSSAASVSLLLNTEGVFTALLAWFAFKENFDRRLVLGMLTIVLGALILSWPTEQAVFNLGGTLAVVAACFAWGVDNNLTRKVSLSDATWIASVKGLVAGFVNLVLALIIGSNFPPLLNVTGAMLVGFLAYGVSLALFVVSLRHLGTARTGAYFSIAPFVGALIAVIMGEPISLTLLLAGGLMALGVWFHLTEKHEHLHTHEVIKHTHEHIHDEHHQHMHETPVAPGKKHTHFHRHDEMTHSHHHFPDVHHQHKH
ncbi:MAG: hypothetical protein PWP74_550 [Shewanella sp.]|nr:hypothetical protein [Shewanella sp.]